MDVALRHARRAVELDPTSALAWSVFANCHIFRAIRGMDPPAEATAAAMAAAKRALQLDPSVADAYVSLGTILSHSGDVAGGLRALEKAVELNPGLGEAHMLLGRALYAYERHAEAHAEINKALSIDPLSMMAYTGVGDAYYFSRDYEKSVFNYRMGLELDPRFDGTHTGLARSLEALSRVHPSGSRISKRPLGTRRKRVASWRSSRKRARHASSRRGESPFCTRVSGTSTKLSAGSTLQSTNTHRGWSCCACIHGSIRSETIRATARSSPG
jgi:predicted Zn-dependent protease